ncbi:MAG: phosphoribosylamine--glycine ligase [Puniceicoccaceae bacterium]|nr:MAG: phosphoribosylamine--glycine ligase [Puniceicoccaceae bacterium]
MKADPLNVLIVGSGGREHALAEACRRSPRAGRLLAAPGNAGIAAICRCLPIAVDDVDGLVDAAEQEQVDFVVVGPEVPLSLGLVDRLADAGIAAFGPTAAGARLEASKSFTKDLLLKNSIPTAGARTVKDSAAAARWLDQAAFPVVVKADGLAAGKGVVICADRDEALRTVRDMLAGTAFGASGKTVLLEEFLEGEEASLHLLVSGRDFKVLPTSQDHKRAGEGDTGLNTGGMGAYSPAPVLEGPMLDSVIETIARPSVEAIASAGIDFRGVLFIGLMLTTDGPKVLEFNTRFGDPETQVILPRIQSDVLELLHHTAHGRLARAELKVRPEHALCVVLAADGYPEAYPKGDPITLPATTGGDGFIYHAGTAATADGTLVTAGGRVLGVTGIGADLPAAAAAAYRLADRISFASKYCRRDIGHRELGRLTPKP